VSYRDTERAGARAFEVRGPNRKVGGAKVFFIDFNPRKACRS